MRAMLNVYYPSVGQWWIHAYNPLFLCCSNRPAERLQSASHHWAKDIIVGEVHYWHRQHDKCPHIVLFGHQSLSAKQSKYFIRTALDDASQVPAIASLIEYFSWRQAVLIYEDSEFGRGIIPYLVDALQDIDTRIPYRSIIPSVPTDDQINLELNKLKTI